MNKSKPGSVRATAQRDGVSKNTALRARHLASPVADDGTVEVDMIEGLDGKLHPSRRYDTTERDEQIRSLRADGLSIRAIAHEVDCSVGTVHRVITEGESK